MPFTLEQIRVIGDDYIQKIKDAGYKVQDITWHLFPAKPRKTYGTCYTAVGTTKADIYINQYLRHEKDVREVIAHEITHAIEQCLSVHHSKVWQAVAYDVCVNVLGLTGGYQRVFHRDLEFNNIKIMFKMTEEGAKFQKHAKFRDATITHELYIDDVMLKKFKGYQENNVLTIISTEVE